jgi:hypothetical protein
MDELSRSLLPAELAVAEVPDFFGGFAPPAFGFGRRDLGVRGKIRPAGVFAGVCCEIVPGNLERPESRPRPGLRRPSAALLGPASESWKSEKPGQSLMGIESNW